MGSVGVPHQCCLEAAACYLLLISSPYCSPGPLNLSIGSGGSSSTESDHEHHLTVGERLGWPQPINGGNGRCGPPMCKAGAIGCGVPNATAKAAGPDPSAPGCGPPSFAVSKLNARAATVMAKHAVPTLDLNALVHSHCGASYSNCSLCDDETKYMGIRCGYHYAPAGVEILAAAVAESFKKLLST